MADKEEITADDVGSVESLGLEVDKKPVDYEGEVNNPAGLSDSVQVKLNGGRQAFFPEGVDGPNPEAWGEEQTLLPEFEQDLINDPNVDGPNPEHWSPDAVKARIHDALPPVDGGVEGDPAPTWEEYIASLPETDES